MHIPEGYLSPQTCLVMGAAVVPFWRRALHRVRAGTQHLRLPLIALGAAFAFAIQMLNVPVPDGTTAHATGAALVAIVLGPWAGLLALTVTLAIQALVFADGGLLALGANVFNMGVLESFTAYALYRLLTRGEGGAGRRVWAAAVGAFVGINVAALATGVELGLQPLLFRTPDGVPLYAPYPLSLAVPAMMYAHLLIAGPLEALVTGLAVAYLVRTGQSLYGEEPGTALAGTVAAVTAGGNGTRPGRIPRWAWWGLGLAVLAAPLGLIASGTAWGEWSPEELKSQLGYVPHGLARWAERWSGFLPGYTVPGLEEGHGALTVGYYLSPLAGLALIALLFYLVVRLVGRAGTALRAGESPWSRRG